MFFSAGAGAMELFGEPLEIVLTSSSGWELSTFGQDGRPRRITRLPIARRSTEGDIEALRTTQLPVAIDVAEVLAEVTEDRILTIWQDEFDVPFLRAYHLARGGG
jgi:hypothetical protein